MLIPTLLAGLAPVLAPTAGLDDPTQIRFDARAAEHLLSRAGFGATSTEVAAAVEAGLKATVARLLAGGDRARDPFFAERLSPYNADRAVRQAEIARRAGGPLVALDREARREVAREIVRDGRIADQRQLEDYAEWWVGSMLEGSDPLRDRMALFWHGYFTSSQEDVRDSWELIEQAELLREGALGSFGDLLRGIARSPAMLEYLDNDENERGEPNENFARELLELFTLGEGHYTERDVLEAARAFTGWTDRDGEFRFRRSKHDGGQKTILGRTGEFDGDDVLELLLEQERTAEYVAGRIVRYLEGREPGPERAARYGAVLRDGGFEVAALLEALFLDPDFYRDEVVGQRIAGPIDFMVGLARRLRVDPPPALVTRGARLIGQRLFHPPNVKGWEGEEAWITTATFMQRGNLAGVLLGEVAIGDLLEGEEPLPNLIELAAMEPEERRAMLPRNRDLAGLRVVERQGWTPRYHLAARLERAGVTSDAEVVAFLLDELLAVPPGPGTLEELVAQLATERVGLDIREGAWRAAGPDGERCLRRLAHLICSLPEAQLH